MATKETNAKPEQRKSKDVHQPTARKKHPGEESIAPPTVQPPGAKDTSEKPEVDPVTGGPL